MPKRLVVCSDGTWADEDRNTNVWQFSACVKRDGFDQLVQYDPGVGTGSLISKVLGGATGFGISKNITDAYGFLARNYEPGDAIYLVGFSRGAYTVRSTAGMIRKCGLLKRPFNNRLGTFLAFFLYRLRHGSADVRVARLFRRLFSHDPVTIKFLGVWDTVGALGIPIKSMNWIMRWVNRFHDVRLSRSVQYAYQALAIDERREVFEATLWEQAEDPGPIQKAVEQVWFAGCHSDIGGGNPTHGLSDITLRWLIAKAAQTGLEFETNEFFGLNPDPHAPKNESFSGFWTHLSERWRPIGLAVRSQESVATVVKTRYQASPEYRPPNLLDYLERTNDGW